MAEFHSWQSVGEMTRRMRVPGGWIYETGISVCFVPLPPQWAEGWELGDMRELPATPKPET